MEAPRDETISTVLADMPTTGGGSAAVGALAGTGADGTTGVWPKIGKKPNESSSGTGTTCRRDIMAAQRACGAKQGTVRSGEQVCKVEKLQVEIAKWKVERDVAGHPPNFSGLLRPIRDRDRSFDQPGRTGERSNYKGLAEDRLASSNSYVMNQSPSCHAPHAHIHQKLY